jgi:hypothetical protein
MVSKPPEELEEVRPNQVPEHRASVRYLGLSLDENSGHTSQCTSHPMKKKTLNCQPRNFAKNKRRMEMLVMCEECGVA